MGYAFSRREGLQKIFKEDKSDKKTFEEKGCTQIKDKIT